MLEFVRVDHAVTKPFTCVCGSHTGPFVRTFFERWGEEIYLCESCVGRAAKANGLVKGKRQMELIQAARRVDSAQRQLAEQTDARAALEAQLGAERDRIAELEQQLEQAHGQLAQWEHLVAGVKETLADPTAPAPV